MVLLPEAPQFSSRYLERAITAANARLLIGRIHERKRVRELTEMQLETLVAVLPERVR